MEGTGMVRRVIIDVHFCWIVSAIFVFHISIMATRELATLTTSIGMAVARANGNFAARLLVF